MGSAQLVIANDTTSHEVTARLQALRVGQRAYIYATMAMSICLLLAAVVEAIRHSFWTFLPKFDFVDFDSTVVASSRGGTGVADEVDWLLERNGRNSSSKDSENGVGGSVQVYLSGSPRGVVLGLLEWQGVADGRYFGNRDNGWVSFQQEEA